MRALEATNAPRSAAGWQMLVCLLLAVLFLYNPFLAGHRDDGAFTVGHPASHRATVGSSELEQFSQRHPVVAPLPDPAVVRTFLDAAAAVPSATPAAADRDEILPPPAFFSSNLWFRPPPAV
jgi:hypothetical protein